MSEDAQLGPSDDGTVMLDIGGDIGALVLHTGPELLHAEIEISPADEQGEDVFQRDNPHHHADGDHSHGHSHGGDSHGHSHGEDSHGHTHGDGGPLRTHVAVRERRGSGGVRYAAIYPGLREGEYTLWGTDGRQRDTVRIRGGYVSEVDWR